MQKLFLSPLSHRRSLIGLCVCVCICICCLLSGCQSQNSTQSHPEWENHPLMQQFADQSWAAKTFAEQAFSHRMDVQGHTDYTVLQTRYGVSWTDDEATPIFTVGFWYEMGESRAMYGYRIWVDSDQNCSLAEEGATVADVLFE